MLDFLAKIMSTTHCVDSPIIDLQRTFASFPKKCEAAQEHVKTLLPLLAQLPPSFSLASLESEGAFIMKKILDAKRSQNKDTESAYDAFCCKVLLHKPRCDTPGLLSLAYGRSRRITALALAHQHIGLEEASPSFPSPYAQAVQKMDRFMAFVLKEEITATSPPISSPKNAQTTAYSIDNFMSTFLSKHKQPAFLSLPFSCTTDDSWKRLCKKTPSDLLSQPFAQKMVHLFSIMQRECSLPEESHSFTSLVNKFLEKTLLSHKIPSSFFCQHIITLPNDWINLCIFPKTREYMGGWGRTFLTLALEHGDIAVAMALLSREDMNPLKKDALHRYPLEYALYLLEKRPTHYTVEDVMYCINSLLEHPKARCPFPFLGIENRAFFVMDTLLHIPSSYIALWQDHYDAFCVKMIHLGANLETHANNTPRALIAYAYSLRLFKTVEVLWTYNASPHECTERVEPVFLQAARRHDDKTLRRCLQADTPSSLYQQAYTHYLANNPTPSQDILNKLLAENENSG